MTIKAFFAVALCFLGVLGAYPGADASEVLSKYEVVEPSDLIMDKVAERFEVVRRVERRFEVIVPAGRAGEFLALVPQARLVMQDLQEEMSEFRTNKLFRDGYRDLSQVTLFLQELEKKYPTLVKLETYGRSGDGRDLYVLKVSDNVAHDEADEPRLMIDAATHGDELITTEVVLNLLQELVDGYGQDDRLTAMVNKTALYFIPVVNPDGFTKQQRYAEGVDPNRNYPYPLKPDVTSISIIQAIRDLAAKHRFAGSMDFHAYGGMIMYPWAYTSDEIEDAAVRAAFHELTGSMAAENGWNHGPIAEVIYRAPGSSADYYFWQFQTKAIAVEVGSRKVPAPREIPRYVGEAREMTWRFIESFFPAPVL